jgi:hypothetical protein
MVIFGTVNGWPSEAIFVHDFVVAIAVSMAKAVSASMARSSVTASESLPPPPPQAVTRNALEIRYASRVGRWGSKSRVMEYLSI